MRQVIVYRGEDNYYIAECPSLPGCISQGLTKEEAVANIKEAIRRYIAALEEDGLPVPEERSEAMLVIKDGVLVIEAEAIPDLNDITQQERDRRLSDLLKRTGF